MAENLCPKCGTACSATARFCIRCRTPLTSVAQKKLVCSKGHRQDPSWKECPFCQGSQTANPIYMAEAKRDQDVKEVFAKTPPANLSRQRTVVETPDMSPQIPPTQPIPVTKPNQSRPVPPLPPPDPYKTVIAETGQAPTATTPKSNLGRGKTQVMNPKAQTQKPAAAKILGVLATFSHNKNGNAFLIRTGRNVIGANQQANIRVKDPNVSDKHAIIQATPAKCVIDDCLSTNGTYVNGKAIEDKTELQPGDIIQTGDTLWRFVAIHPPDPSEKVSP